MYCYFYNCNVLAEDDVLSSDLQVAVDCLYRNSDPFNRGTLQKFTRVDYNHTHTQTHVSPSARIDKYLFMQSFQANNLFVIRPVKKKKTIINVGLIRRRAI